MRDWSIQQSICSIERAILNNNKYVHLIVHILPNCLIVLANEYAIIHIISQSMSCVTWSHANMNNFPQFKSELTSQSQRHYSR